MTLEFVPFSGNTEKRPNYQRKENNMERHGTNEVVIYARTSTTDQTLDQQVTACRVGLAPDVAPRILHEQLSGWKGTRPEYELLKQLIRKNWVKELRVFSISRLGRNVQEASRLLELCQQHSVRVKVVTESLDFSGPLGYALFTLFAALAQMDSDTKSMATRAKLAYKREHDGWQCHGSPPHTIAQKVKDKAPEVYKMLDDGKPYRYVAKMLHLSESSIMKLNRLRGYPLLTREDFARLYPGWHEWPKDQLKALTMADVLARHQEVTSQQQESA